MKNRVNHSTDLYSRLIYNYKIYWVLIYFKLIGQAVLPLSCPGRTDITNK